MNIVHTIFEIVGILSAILTMIGHMPALPAIWRNRALALGANIRAYMDASGIKSPVATAMDTVKKTAENSPINLSIDSTGRLIVPVGVTINEGELYCVKPCAIKEFDPEETLDSAKYEDDHADKID